MDSGYIISIREAIYVRVFFAKLAMCTWVYIMKKLEQNNNVLGYTEAQRSNFVSFTGRIDKTFILKCICETHTLSFLIHSAAFQNNKTEQQNTSCYSLNNAKPCLTRVLYVIIVNVSRPLTVHYITSLHQSLH